MRIRENIQIMFKGIQLQKDCENLTKACLRQEYIICAGHKQD